MINVPIDKIVPLTTARDTLSKLVSEVETKTPMYVLTKGGKPSVAIVNIEYLEKALSGNLVMETAKEEQPSQPGPPEESKPDEPEPVSPGTATIYHSPSEVPPEPLSVEPPPPPAPEPVTIDTPQPVAPISQSPDQTTPPNPAPPTPLSPPLPADPTSSPVSPPPPPPQPTDLPTPPNIALGSMDGIQSKPTVEAPEPPQTADPNYTPNPAQYTGQTDPQTGLPPTTDEPADMVID